MSGRVHQTAKRYEEWNGVVGFPDYEVSTHGRVRSRDRTRISRHPRNQAMTHTRVLKGKILKQQADKDGYAIVTIRVDGQSVTCRVARLVLAAFAGDCPDGLQACHFPDSDRMNNHIENLMWGTPQENRRHQDIHGSSQVGQRHWKASLTQIQVDEIRHQLRMGCKQKQLAIDYRVSPQVINNIARNKRWSKSHTAAEPASTSNP